MDQESKPEDKVEARRRYHRDYARGRYHSDTEFRERKLRSEKLARSKNEETVELYRLYYRLRKRAERAGEKPPLMAEVRKVMQE